MTFLHSGHNSKINLSAKDMLEISREISRNFSPCFSSGMPQLVEKIRLSSKELFDIGQEIGRDYAPKVSQTIPEVTLLPVDPGHLHAYWNLGNDREVPASGNESKEQLTLRIYAQADEGKAADQTPSWFDIAIDDSATRQQVTLPNPVDETVYSAVIGKQSEDHGFIVFAHSNIIHAPHGAVMWSQDHDDAATYCPNKNASGQGAG
ncbi:MAG: DUF4912 domain-containing protein, partial [Methylobacter sp.]